MNLVPALSVRNLSKVYHIYEKPSDRLRQFLYGQRRTFYKEFWALQDISLEIGRGEAVGVVGRNGGGKSTLLQLIAGTLSPTSGEVGFEGRCAALLELGSGFNPDFTGRENVRLNASILGMSEVEIDQAFDAIHDFSEIGDSLEQPVKTYSSGMLLRLAFAVQIHARPDVLIVDEALAVGDMAFQRKCIARIEAFVAGGGVLLFVSHDLETVRRLCSEAIYLEHGLLRAKGPAKTVCDLYERELFGASPLTGSRAGDSGGERALFDQTLERPACAEDYGNGGGRIVDYFIEDADGVRVNTLEGTQQFHWCFDVEFDEAVEDCVFGMMVKTREGVNVYSSNTDSLKLSRFSFSPGDRIRVRFALNNVLAGGVYFLNCGVSCHRDASVDFLHRIVDAAIIRVIDDGRSSGLANLQAEFSADRG
jgi:lipopolysaccharide transport system ATP-binding protein